VPVHEIALIALAAFGAGAINVVAGSGTLITFPTLVAFGYDPVSATISNGIGLVLGNVSGVWGYRRELEGQGNRLRWQIPAVGVGAIIGSFLLLLLPASTFLAVVPVLLVLSLILVVTGPRIQAWAKRHAEAHGTSNAELSRERLAVLTSGNFLVGIYGGYFTAAQGIMQIALMGAVLPESLQRMNATKNVLTLVANVVSAVAYVALAPDRVNWLAAGIIAAGSFVGGLAGARWGRMLSPTALRGVIVVVGLVGLWRLLV
jgi:uncharacterized protein